MKNKILIFLLLVLACSTLNCSKPENKKNVKQQTIETPVMKMSEAPTDSPAGTAPSAAPEATQLPQGANAPSAPQTMPIATSSTPTIVKTNTNIELILDASGSMNSPTGQVTKIEALKTALQNVLTTPVMPELAMRKIALRTFGNNSPAEKNDCHDTILEAPMEKFDQAKLSQALDKMLPKGTAPIAFALESAFNDFSEPNEKTDNQIILITDSADSCSGDIIAAAKRLQASKKIILDIIGFDVDQTTQELLKSAAAAGSGTFYLARNAGELASMVDQALSSNMPYNLRVRVANNVPSMITVYRANTQSIVERTESTGVKFLKLTPGSYDIRVEYLDSIEKTKPSKIIKGVEVSATTKTEQIVQFDLGTLNLTAINQNGKESIANFYIRKSGGDDVLGRLLAVPSPQSVILSPGTYDVDAESAEEGTATLTAQAKGIEVKDGETVEQILKFQTGQINIKAQNLAKASIPITYRITKPGSPEVVASGTGPIEGITVDLPPGKYDVYVAWTDPNIQGSPETKLADITITGGETLEQLATIVTGTLKLSGKDSQGKPTETTFVIKKQDDPAELAKVTSGGESVEIFVAPGTYDVVATNVNSKVVPPPSVEITGIVLKEGETVAKEALFKLGSIKLIGKNAKQQTIPTTFTVYRGGTDEPLVVETSQRDWITFSLTPGLYDIKAEEAESKTETKPTVWFHDVEIKEGIASSSEAVFTAGKLKVICRGKNNIVLTCEFNVFAYGQDSALYSGTTGEDWKEFDIQPGKYYMEAGWHDPVEEQFLKKWINIEVSENEIVEQTLRF